MKHIVANLLLFANVMGFLYIYSERVLAMDCIRFLRDCLCNDNFWNRRFIEEELFDNVIRVFEHNGLQSSNLLNSTILSLFERINEFNISQLIQYLGQLQIEDDANAHVQDEKDKDKDKEERKYEEKAN
ncbi:hypothetical protein RFI_25018, partial [Reticulomyxa filosa]